MLSFKIHHTIHITGKTWLSNPKTKRNLLPKSEYLGTKSAQFYIN